MKKQLKKVISVVLMLSILIAMGLPTYAKSNALDGEFLTQEIIDACKEETERRKEEAAQFLNSGISVHKTLQGVPFLSQDDSRWKNLYFPCHNYTYGSYGCAVTSYAMMSRWYNNNGETPVTFATKLNNKYSYCPCDQDAWMAAGTMGRTVTMAEETESKSDIELAVVSALNNDELTIIRIQDPDNSNFTHYVLAYGYEYQGGRPVILIKDPEQDFSYTTMQQYYDRGYIPWQYATI